MSASIAALADRYGCELRGDGAHEVTHVAPLGEASSNAISFLANSKFRAQLQKTSAGAVILQSADASDCPVACLIHENPYAIYARIAAELHPAAVALAGIHADASIANDAQIAASAEIGPRAVIGPGAVIGDAVRVLAGAVIGSGATVGHDSCIGANVSIGDRVRIGARCIIHPGAVIGADGFGFALDAGTWVKVPQLGSVLIGDDVEVGANTTIDRGTINDTIIEDGVKLDNLVQIAHNVRIGAHSVMAAMSGAAGSTVIGKRCMIGGGTVMINHISLCDDVLVLFRSVVTKSITKPGTYSGSLPADEANSWRRNAARFKQLDRLADRVYELEKRNKSQPD